MFDVGKVVMKIAGRDAGKVGVIVDVLDETYVLIDGDVRRRKVNIAHIEPMANSVKVKKGASHDEVAKALGLEAKKPRKLKKEKSARPKTAHKAKPKIAAPKEAKTPKAAAEKPKKKVAKKNE